MWFMVLELDNLCEEELFQNEKVGIIPDWRLTGGKVLGFVALTAVSTGRIFCK